MRKTIDTNEIPYLKPTSKPEITLLPENVYQQFKLHYYETKESETNKVVYKQLNVVSDRTQEIHEKSQKSLIKADWFLIVILFYSLIAIWIRLRFKKQYLEFFQSVFRYKSAVNNFRNRSLSSQRIAFLLNIMFCLSFGLFVFQNMEMLGLKKLLQNQKNLIALSFSIPLVYILYKYIITGLTGLFSGTFKLFREYLYNSFLFLKLLGVVYFPLVILIAYVYALPQSVIVIISVAVLMLTIILWLIRTIQLFIQKGVSIFLMILYLCALEILPILLLIKFLISRG